MRKLPLATAVAALLSWRFVERPLLGWKDRFRYGEPAGACAAVGRSSASPAAVG